ncbi:MAG TPA: EAL domain-containing protein [Azonexus sp.]
MPNTRPPTPAGEPLDHLLSRIDVGIQLWDADERLCYANAVSASHFGRQTVPAMAFAELSTQWRELPDTPLPAGLARIAGAEGGDAQLQIQFVHADPAAVRWLELRVHLLPDGGGAERILTTTTDITRLVADGLRLQRQAHYDALTGLPNRTLLADRLQIALAQAKRRGESLAVCLMDLDGFKPVNDTLGHKAGDQLLQEVAHRLQQTLRREDTAARTGGDEFALLIGGLKATGEVERTVQRLLQAIAAPVLINGQAVRISASIGVTLYPGDVFDADQLLRHADQAMYLAKNEGKNRYHLFDPAIASQARAKQGLLRKIEEALAHGQFTLHYQPKVDCRKGCVAGLEALIRWDHPVLGLRAPGEFLPLIEHDDLIIRLGEWVLSRTLDQMQAWDAAGLVIPVSINISARHFLRSNFPQHLSRMLSHYPASLLQRLEVEIVETAALEDINLASELIREFREHGISFALDDFGTGYSSLVHLKRLAVSTLKIDQTFVRDMLDDPGDLAIVQGIIGLANAFQETVVAEGVESIEQILMLLELGCDVMQGYGIARPMPAERVAGWLTGFQADPRWQAAGGYPLRRDFELLLMEVAHRHWLDLLLSSPRGQTGKPPAGTCRLTHWCHSDGRKHYAGLPEFFRLEELHHEVHRHAENYVAALSAADSAGTAREREALIAANGNFIALLHNFRVALATERVD